MKSSWNTTKLDDLCEKITDGSHFSPKSIDTGYPYITVKNISNDRIDFVNCKFISKESYEVLDKNGCRPLNGDVLFSKDGTVGKVSLVDYSLDFVVLSSLAIIRPNQNILYPQYLRYLLKAPFFLQEAIGKKTGVAIRRIVLRNLKAIQVPYPKINEQKRIVAILDQTFAEIEKARANAEQNLKNARELFESYLQQVFSQRGDGWVENVLGNVCKIVGGGTPSKSNESFYEGNIPWATVRDMKQDLLCNTEHEISKEAVAKSSTNIIKKGSVITATRVGLGKVCILNQDTAINQDLKAIIPINNSLSKLFLYWWLKSIAHVIETAGVGATVKGVKLTFVKGLAINIPPISEQERVSNNLTELKKQVNLLELVYQNKLLALDELKKSILQKAFTGELTKEAAT